MIYHLYFGLIMAGFMAPGLLYGGYMMHYSGARESDLGFIFMLMPVTIFLRPLICAHADRYQLHKQMLAAFALLTSLAYLPYIWIPVLLERQLLDLAPGARFWLLVAAHLVGSVGFCGVRSLGDALAVNYAKQIGSAYARYRKYGAISFGVCGYLLGFVNQSSRWLPDFVPCFVVYSASMLALALLVYLWPDEYFTIRRQQRAQEPSKQQQQQWPTSGEIAAHMAGKLWRLISCQCFRAGPEPAGATGATSSGSKGSYNHHHHQQQQATAKLSVRQQAQIFLLLMRRDFRIGLYLLAILYGGLVGYSGPNFVFTWMGGYCAGGGGGGRCDAAQLAGLVMIAYCSVETLCYIAIDKLRARLNRQLMLELTFASLMLHYYFYGLLLESVSPYWFLVESLHGVEYSISLATSVELGYLFGNEVELIMDELVERKIIPPPPPPIEDDHSAAPGGQADYHELVKVSLMATMSGCFTLCYDGFGCILGVLTFGLIIARHSFVTCWLVVGTMAAAGLAALVCVHLAGRCLGVRPRILQLRDKQAGPPA